MAALALVFRHVLADVVRVALALDHYSHILVIPFLSGFLLYRDRQKIFSSTVPTPGLGLLVALPAVLLFWHPPDSGGGPDGYLFARALGVFVLVLAAFIFCYGVKAFRAAAFPLLFLFLAVPLPLPMVEAIIVFLQKGSAAFSEALFALTSVPFLRQGFVFQLPDLTIEIAKECSGIRSSMALLVTTLFALHLFLQSWWKKWVVVAALVPIILFKNALRIVTLSLLSIYVDPRFLSGWLHTSGGIVFYLLALAVIGLVIRLLGRKRAPVEPIASARVAY